MEFLPPVTRVSSPEAARTAPFDVPTLREEGGQDAIYNGSSDRRSITTGSQDTQPASAPARIGDTPVFASHQEHRILPFQTQYAEQLERYIHTGPIVGPARSKRQRPSIKVIVEDTDPSRHGRTTLLSDIGSDIIRRDNTRWSPDSAPTSSDGITPVSRAPSSFRASSARNSNLSVMTSSSRGSSGSSASVSHQPSTRRKTRLQAESSLRLPSRSAPRSSVASGRTFGGGRDELPAVIEGQPQSPPGSRSLRYTRSVSASRTSTTTKRMVISRPQSLRPIRQPSFPVSRQPTVQSGPSPPSPVRLASEYLTIAASPRSPRPPPSPPLVPATVRSLPPALQASVTRPSSRYAAASQPGPSTPPSGSFERAQGSGRLRGPRSPPMPSATSTPNLHSGWPAAEPTREEYQVHRRQRSGSCPELPPLDFTPRGTISTKR